MDALTALRVLTDELRTLDAERLRGLSTSYRTWRDVLPAAIDDSLVRISRGRARVLQAGPAVTAAMLASPGAQEVGDDVLEDAMIAAWLYALETIGDGDRAIGRLLAAPFNEALGARAASIVTHAS